MDSSDLTVLPLTVYSVCMSIYVKCSSSIILKAILKMSTFGICNTSEKEFKLLKLVISIRRRRRRIQYLAFI